VFIRHVEKGEQAMVRLVLDREIVEAMTAGQRRPVEARVQALGARAQERRSSLPEEIAVMQLVDRVLEIQAAQEAVGGYLSRTKDVTSTIGLDLGKREKL